MKFVPMDESGFGASEVLVKLVIKNLRCKVLVFAL